MTFHWREHGPGVDHQPGRPPPHLCSACCLPPPASTFYMLVGGVLHPSEMTIAGWLLLLLITAAFRSRVDPLVGRKRTWLDSTCCEATEELISFTPHDDGDWRRRVGDVPLRGWIEQRLTTFHARGSAAQRRPQGAERGPARMILPRVLPSNDKAGAPSAQKVDASGHRSDAGSNTARSPPVVSSSNSLDPEEAD